MLTESEDLCFVHFNKKKVRKSKEKYDAETSPPAHANHSQVTLPAVFKSTSEKFFGNKLVPASAEA